LYLLFEKLEIGNKSERKVLLTLKTDQGELRPTLRQMGKQGRQRSQKGGQSIVRFPSFRVNYDFFLLIANFFSSCRPFPDLSIKCFDFSGKNDTEKKLWRKKKSNEFLFFVV